MSVSLKVFITSVLVFLVRLLVSRWTLLAIGRSAAEEAARKAWNERAAGMAKDVELLGSFLGTEEERTHHQEATIAFVKGLAEAHGGHVEVEFEERWGGSFLVRLPREVAPPVGAASPGAER
jgi:hypothetical protein